MKLRIRLILACLLISSLVYSQTTPPNMIPPSPMAYSLGKYGDVPVSLYTGVPNISVPIYSLKDHTIGVDVSLSYHASGIKVDETASNAGLGWALNAGGVITRIVRGAPETLISGNVPYPDHWTGIKFYDEFSPSESNSSVISDDKLYVSATNQVDTEPDIFYYNFGDKSGKFIFDKNGNAVLEKQDGLDIKWQYVSSGVEKFIIKDEKGNTYEFDDHESTNFSGNNVISAWYLNTITSPTGNVITFQYSNLGTSTPYVRSYAEQYVEVSHGATSAAIITPTATPFIGSGTNEIRLSRIKSANGTIVITYQGTPRKDYALYANSYAIDAITIYKPDSTVLKSYKLITDYFKANNYRKYSGTDTALYNFMNYRLRLDSVRVLSAAGTPMQPAYRFSYLGSDDPTVDDAYTLPYRLSSQQDHWGYYNKSYNVHILPGKDDEYIKTPAWYSILTPISDYPSYVALTSGADREPDSAAMKAGMISKMYYPTGGYTQFFFEPNTNDFGGLRIKKMMDYPVTGLPKETDYTYTSYYEAPDPDDEYFQAYAVDYSDPSGPSPTPGVLNSFGVPYIPGSSGYHEFVKVTAQPQAILGRGSSMGYNIVRETHPGNGYTESSFDGSYPYNDYNDNDYIPENATLAHPLDRAFESEYIDDSTYPNPGGYLASTPIPTDEWPYPETYSNSWERGTLTSKYSYSESGTPIKAESYTYYRQLLSAIPGFKVKLITGGSANAYVFAKYYSPNGWIKPASTATTDYDMAGHNGVTSTTTYYYDNMAHMQPTRTVTTRSDGNTEVTNTLYPLDYTYSTAPSFIQGMQNQHLLAYPVEQVKYKSVSGTLTNPSGTLTYYNGYTGLPSYIQTLKNTKDFSTTALKFSNRTAPTIPTDGAQGDFAPDSRYETRLNFNTYNLYGDVISVNKTGGPATIYVWSYNNQYPVAKVENSDFATVETALGGSTAFYNLMASQPASDAALSTALAPLRSLAGTLVTTYTYKPLVGMTSMTDPKGQTTYYEYDSFNRLINVKDKDGHIIKHTDYHYQNQ